MSQENRSGIFKVSNDTFGVVLKCFRSMSYIFFMTIPRYIPWVKVGVQQLCCYRVSTDSTLVYIKVNGMCGNQEKEVVLLMVRGSVGSPGRKLEEERRRRHWGVRA